MRLRKIIIFIFAAVSLSIFSYQARAEGNNLVQVVPGIIDQKVKARDIVEESIVIKNTLENKAFVYAVVYDILSDGTSQFATSSSAVRDKTTSVADWTQVTGGVIEINPGKEVTVPIRLDININAAPGRRYGAIAFVNASDRYQAEDLARTTKQPILLMNIEVEDQVVERAQLDSFSSEKNIFLFPLVGLDLSIKNIGNVDILPKGNIHIYNRRGLEVALLDINANNQLVSNQTNFIFHGEWKDGVKIGRYKAKLAAQYGERSVRDLQDDIFFWVLPWQFLLLFIILLICLFVLLIRILKKKNYHHSDSVVRPVYQTVNQGKKNNVINLKM